eukprot:10960360-Alexandrium_andersonii.AAC.1
MRDELGPSPVVAPRALRARLGGTPRSSVSRRPLPSCEDCPGGPTEPHRVGPALPRRVSCLQPPVISQVSELQNTI